MESAVFTASTERVRPRALDASTLCEAFQMTVVDSSDRVALRTIGDGISLAFRDYAERVRRIAGGFHALGVRRGDTVALMLTNRPEFNVVDTAVMHLGAAGFSIYNTASPEQIAYVIGDSGARVLVVEAAFLDRARAAMIQTGQVEQLIVLDAAPDDAITLEQLESLEPGDEFDFEATWRAVEADDVLTVIYTSGTTGPPKGVQLTHANQVAQMRALDGVNATRTVGGMIVSYLPAAHIADRCLMHYQQMIWAHTLTTCPDPAQVFAHVLDARPTVFGSVPRIWEKLKAAVEAQIDAEPDEARRELVLAAIELGLQKVRAEQAGEPISDELRQRYELAEEHLFAKLRARLGFERCESYSTGSAPTPLEVLEFFGAIGIPIREMWGMSELSCVATYVPEARIRFGTVGQPLPGVEVKIAEDGEVLVRGAIVMAGYRNQPQLTAETIDADGWLHTGDIGELDGEGFLRIVDRKKELIINAAGKNMSPANIEQHLRSGSALIGQAIAVGDRRPYNVALIVLDRDACAAFARQHGLADDSPTAIARNAAVLEEVRLGVERANSHLSRVEQIKRFEVLACDWPVGGDELTPTLKLKRKPILEKYASEIESLYAA